MARLPLAMAQEAAAALVELLRPGCERIEVAGSVRRRNLDCKDIEVVAVPRFAPDLFGGAGDDLLNRAVLDGTRPTAGLGYRDSRTGETATAYDLEGRKFYPLFLYHGLNRWPVDLFAVRPPAQWGAIFAIRTGPSDYSARLVTALHARQLKCAEGRLVSTALATAGDVIDTPEESDFIEACGMPYLPPEKRK